MTEGIAPELAAFLARQTPVAEGDAAWAGGSVRLILREYLTTEPPPLRFVGSVRSVVFKGDKLLVVRNPDGRHVLPGGSCEVGETPAETLTRELLEETGWTVRQSRPIGFTWLHILTPPGERARQRPELYPDFVWLIYVSNANEYHAEAKLPDDYELDSAFVPLAEIGSVELHPHSRLFLEAALNVRAQ